MPFIYADTEEIYKKNKDLKKEDVKCLREWMEKQPHLPSVYEIDHIFFLHSCYYSIEKAKVTVENYYTCKTASPEVFGKKDLAEFQKSFNEVAYVPLPKLTPEGYQILFVQIIDCDPNLYNFNNHVKLVDGCMKIHFLGRGPPEGFVMVLNLEGFVFGHITKVPIMSLKKLMMYLQEGLPVRLKYVHVINTNPVVEKILALLKPFMKAELIQIVHFHTNNHETLYKYIPKELLPSDFGGKQDSVAKLHEANIKNLYDKLDFFDIEEGKWTDESKRPNKCINNNVLYGVEGSFKKLEID